jgi:RNA polymerase sigma factor (sigma-70 family)
MYPHGYYANEKLFRVYPAVVRANVVSTLTVISDTASHPFLDETVYEVRFVPKDERKTEDERTIREAVASLEERERTIIEMRYGMSGRREMTQKEVADALGISQSYISRLEKRIIGRLKKQIASKI